MDGGGGGEGEGEREREREGGGSGRRENGIIVECVCVKVHNLLCSYLTT